MKPTFSRRMNSIPESIFITLNEKKILRERAGLPVYNLSIGTPDFPPDRHVMAALEAAARDPENYKYAITDLPELVDAVRMWYGRRYGVSLAADEVMSVYGSQEGLAHIAFPLCNPGDIVLTPNPGYQIFSAGPYLAGAELVDYPLLEENGFLPDLEKIPEEIADRAKIMVVSYPANPVCATAPRSFYEELVRFANRHNIIVVHDNAYSEIVFDGEEGISFLSIPGAKEIGVELNSLSKTYRMTGCRISFAVGSRDVIAEFKKFRSQIDYGVFLPVQKAAIAALTGPQESVAEQRRLYQERRDALCGGLRGIGWPVADSKGTMFVWAPVPDRYPDSLSFALDLIEKSGVICVPGSSFGSLGDRYVRMALVLPPERIRELVSAIDQSGILKG